MEENEVLTPETENVSEAAEVSAEENGCGEFEEHILCLQQQAEDMAADFPEFSLEQELQNPVFLQLTAPGTGISVADAYYALHHQEIQKTAERQTREQVVSAIRSGLKRPVEAGSTGQGPSTIHFSYGNATREQRDAFKKELHRAWGRGETVYP